MSETNTDQNGSEQPGAGQAEPSAGEVGAENLSCEPGMGTEIIPGGESVALALRGDTALAVSTISERKLAANRSNALKSTGPRTPEGKQRASRNSFARSARLLGVVEARMLNQEPDAAGRLFRELIAPYEPAPPILALHFQDMARLQLEQQAWERIRDAMVEDRAQQNRLEIRRRFREMDQELKATADQVSEEGLCRLPDSPGKFKKQIEYLDALKSQLTRRDFHALALPLKQLYGKEYKPDYERAQLICADCVRLMKEKGAPLADREFQALLILVDAELRDAENAYELQLDERTLTPSGCIARLAPFLSERSFLQYGEQLRRAIDRNRALTPKLLEVLGLGYSNGPTSENNTTEERDEKFSTESKPSRIAKSLKTRRVRSASDSDEANKSFRINKQRSHQRSQEVLYNQ